MNRIVLRSIEFWIINLNGFVTFQSRLIVLTCSKFRALNGFAEYLVGIEITLRLL